MNEDLTSWAYSTCKRGEECVNNLAGKLEVKRPLGLD